uniref:Ig-like domain-containing protein n=1 Tax=Poecilia latipinna TaxID=48699 RepID=A0A3B3TMG7_9TELE
MCPLGAAVRHITGHAFHFFTSSCGFIVQAELNVFLVFVSSLITMETDCLLPCQIQLGSDPLIHWYQVSAGDLLVHSYYHNKDQLGKQNQNFKNRTSLILDQISTGNASLLLKEVNIQDEGRYKCYTSTSTGYKESFINLQTEAPVSDIRIHQDGNRITCSSEGIYPQPELTWSTEPPSNTTLNETTRIQKTEDQLYNISSSLTGPDGPDLIYSCSIRTRRNQKTETFIKPGEKTGEQLLINMTLDTEMNHLNGNTGSDSKQGSTKQGNKNKSITEEPGEMDPLETPS